MDEDRRAQARAKSLMELVGVRRGSRNAWTEMVAVLGGVYGVAAREEAIEFDKRRRVSWRVEDDDDSDIGCCLGFCSQHHRRHRKRVSLRRK